MAETIRTLAQQHYSYPIVHFFHARHRRTSLPLSVAMLHGACEETVPDHEPPPLTVHLLRTAVEDLLRAVSSAYLTLDHDEGTTAHLRRFVEDDGWDWDAVHDAPVH